MNPMDIFGQDTMYLITYQVGKPNGGIRSHQRWTQAKDEADARRQITELLTNEKLPWFKITRIKKLN